MPLGLHLPDPSEVWDALTLLFLLSFLGTSLSATSCLSDLLPPQMMLLTPLFFLLLPPSQTLSQAHSSHSPAMGTASTLLVVSNTFVVFIPPYL